MLTNAQMKILYSAEIKAQNAAISETHMKYLLLLLKYALIILI